MAHALAVDYTQYFANAAANVTATGAETAVSAGVNAVSSIGAVGLVLTVFNFLATSIPSVGFYWPAVTSVMRVAVALNSFDGMNADGDAPDVRLWTENGHFTGITSDPGHIPEGAFKDIGITHTGYNTQQPAYALLSANNNAICVAYAQQTWPDGQTRAWLGNWGRTCEQEWYHSGIIIDGKSLECTWMDANGDKTTTGIQIHFPDFEDRGKEHNKDVDYLCNHESSLSFRKEKDPSTVSYYVDKRASTRRPRAEPVPARNATRLIKSHLTTHSASSLCESGSSRGPDFVSHAEGQFCDMDTKTLWPICTSAQDLDCFDNETVDVRLAAGKRDESGMPSKTYKKVTVWQ